MHESTTSLKSQSTDEASFTGYYGKELEILIFEINYGTGVGEIRYSLNDDPRQLAEVFALKNNRNNRSFVMFTQTGICQEAFNKPQSY